ncbi:MAG: nitroreductase family protein [Candidatus Omnitrophica bacterium]|nr:nitroreductase family protein [Candidatus Omnitrophota bacterium]
MELFDAIKMRCSVREYRPMPIPEDSIWKIADAGRLAPTARKEEPWEFIAVTEKNTLKAMADIADHGKFIENAACAIIVCCRDTKYYLEDGCAATENMLVAAAGLGIGSCWVAGDKKAYCQKILELVKAPKEYRLISIIALGYPANPAIPLKKRPLEKVLHWQKF